ncbi:MAG: cytochrome c oxidase assembly protein [Acidimicrobiales bacterium]
MTGGAARKWPLSRIGAEDSGPEPDYHSTWRSALLVPAGVLLVFVVVPQFVTWARSYEWVQAVQFAALAVVGPALLVIGAPWRSVGLGRRALELSESRKRHPEPARSAGFLVVELGVLVAWRTPAAVNWLQGSAWRVLLEAAVLMIVGVLYWLEIVESPPLSPRSTQPVRMVLAASAMWTIWVLAYLVGLSHANWYRSYHHVGGLSLAADQQVTTGVLWAISACVFIPVIFRNLVVWLRSEEDPDRELHRLAKLERRRQAWHPTEERKKPVPPQA